jgi:phycoerythrin-associated linker protein
MPPSAMAFVPATPLASSAFAGRSVVNTCRVPTKANVVLARLGGGTGQINTSLDKLGIHKSSNERFLPLDNVRPAGFSADYEEIIQGAYRQIFGNAYIMESERAEMSKIESEYRDGRLSTKDFCRALAKTYQYRKRFFDGRPLYGAIELNFKHLLGRTPDGLEQYRARSAVYDTQGYDKFIDAFFDDGEYDQFFGDWCVPFVRGHLTTSNLSMCAFTHMFFLHRGQSTSDKSNPRIMTNKIPLNRAGIQSIPIPVVNPGSAGGCFMSPDASTGSWQNGVSGATMARTSLGARQGNDDRKMYRLEVTGFSQGGANNGRSGVTLRSRSGKFYNTRNGSAAKFSEFRRANQVYLVPFSELSATYVQVHKQGGKIASIASV